MVTKTTMASNRLGVSAIHTRWTYYYVHNKFTLDVLNIYLRNSMYIYYISQYISYDYQNSLCCSVKYDITRQKILQLIHDLFGMFAVRPIE